MSGSMTDYMEAAVLNYIFRSTSIGLDATNLWIGLGTAGSDAAFTELSGGAYARVAVVRTGAGFDAASGTSPTHTQNTGAATFPTATADWNSAANITHFCVADAATAGNILYWATLTTPKPVFNGDTAAFGIGQLVVTQD